MAEAVPLNWGPVAHVVIHITVAKPQHSCLQLPSHHPQPLPPHHCKEGRKGRWWGESCCQVCRGRCWFLNQNGLWKVLLSLKRWRLIASTLAVNILGNLHLKPQRFRDGTEHAVPCLFPITWWRNSAREGGGRNEALKVLQGGFQTSAIMWISQ